MSYFDEWMEDYFSEEDAKKIYSIGCHSRTASSRKQPDDIRIQLKELNVHEDVIEEFLAGVFPDLHKKERKERERLKGIVVYQVDVLSLPPIKAEAFLERVRDNVKKQAAEKFAQWGIIVTPVRNQGNRVFVYSLNGTDLEEIKPVILDHGKFMNIHDQETPESITEYVKIMLGAPVLKVAESVIDCIEHYVERAFEYDVNHKQQFVLEEVQEWVEQDDNGTLRAVGW